MKATSYKNPTFEKLGLQAYKIVSAEGLTMALDGGLRALYQHVFAGPPYNEQFADAEVDAMFKDYLDSGGHIFLACDRQEKPVAFVASVPLKAEFDVAATAAGRLDPEKAAYFAEDGVHETHRKHGISAAMKTLLLSACAADRLETMLLRTSVYNYRQICAVNKAGGCVINGLFQKVSSKKSDGSMIQDTRSFYTFDLKDEDAAQVRTLDRVTIVRPGGNDTAIVWDDIPRVEQGAVSLKIQSTYPGIEQVMFVEKGLDGLRRGQMAGGEFCGNATRSLGYLLLDGKDGEIVMEASGAAKPVTVTVANGMAQTSLPVKEDLESAVAQGEDYIVHLNGISFVITGSDKALGRTIMSGNDEDAQKLSVMNILTDNGFAKDYPASGVMIADRQDDGSYKLEPFVYVRDTGTLYYETGCGSGSTSVGVMQAKITGQSIDNLKITQPSGMDLLVSIQRTADRFSGATVNGPIEVLFDGRMHIAEPAVKKPVGAVPDLRH